MKITINEFINSRLNESGTSPICTYSHTPNAKTRKALKNIEAGRNITRVKNIEELLKDLNTD